MGQQPGKRVQMSLHVLWVTAHGFIMCSHIDMVEYCTSNFCFSPLVPGGLVYAERHLSWTGQPRDSCLPGAEGQSLF